jgi:hypothetical protein
MGIPIAIKGETVPRLQITPASHLLTDAAPDFALFSLKLFAQGDSWFSINGLSLFSASSLLMRLRFSKDTVIVNCADPGDTLKHMVDWRRDPFFFRYFASGPNFEEKWDGLLLSGGGNDLIDALGVTPQDANGVPRMKSERLLLTAAERAGDGPLSKYVSQEGWAVFREHMREQFRALGELRSGSAKNRDTPIFTHTYAYAQPRNVGAGPLGPWLFPSLIAYQVPRDDWLALTRHFIDLLHDDILSQTNLPSFHIVDTRTMIPPAPADPDLSDTNWLNEIHPTAKGYDQLGPHYVRLIENIVPR